MKALLQSVSLIHNGHFFWCPTLSQSSTLSSDCFRCKAHGYLIALVFGIAVAGLEFWGSVITLSLSLLSDAWHVTFDVLGYGLGLSAMWRMIAAQGNVSQISRERQRFEGLMALCLIVAAVIILREAFLRVFSGAPEIIETFRMFVITSIGLLFNIATYYLFKNLSIQHEHGDGECTHSHHQGEEDDILRANIIHTLTDAAASVLVLILSLIFMFFSDPRFRYLDLLGALVICTFLFHQAYKILAKRYRRPS